MKGERDRMTTRESFALAMESGRHNIENVHLLKQSMSVLQHPGSAGRDAVPIPV